MSSTNSLNKSSVLIIANNHFTQHAMTSGQVEEVLARSEEVVEGHYDNRSLLAIQPYVLADSPDVSEYSEGYQAAEKKHGSGR